MRALKIVCIGALVLALTAPSWGLSFITPYNGPVELKFKNWDLGTIYNVADGTHTGEAALDALTQTHPSPRFDAEDSWGVVQLTSIIGVNGNVLLWANTPSTPEITGIFYGEKDQFLSQTTSGGNVTQQIEGTGFKIVFFEDPGNDLGDPKGTLGGFTGPNRRTGRDVFLGATEGTVLWTLKSVPGFGPGSNEFFTTFSPTGNIIFGSFNAVGGMQADLVTSLPGPDGIAGNGDDRIPTLNALFAGTENDGSPDWGIRFTGKQDTSPIQWDVISNDPVNAVMVPEPVTMIGVLLSVFGLGGYLRRRQSI